jgi:hypothetical protein
VRRWPEEFYRFLQDQWIVFSHSGVRITGSEQTSLQFGKNYCSSNLGVSHIGEENFYRFLGNEKIQFALGFLYPHGRTETEMVADLQKLLKALRADAANDFTNIISADESWYYWSYDDSSSWSTSRALMPTRALTKIDSKQ